jgi:putative sterol carrier protein
MAEVQTKEGEQLIGLGVIAKTAIDKNLQIPKKVKKIENLKASIILKETESNAAVTMYFDRGQVAIHNGAIDKPNATMAGTWENLGKVLLGEINMYWAALTFRVKVRGNLFKVLKASNVIILGKQKDG